MPLIIIALFLASFLTGSGVSYLTQTQPDLTTPGAVGAPTPYATPDPLTACLPDPALVQKRLQFTGKTIFSIEATKDLPIPKYNDDQDSGCPFDGICGSCGAEGWEVPEEKQLHPDDICSINSPNATLRGEAQIALKDNWDKVLLWMFGGEFAKTDAIPDPKVLDRRTKVWTLIKQDAPLPAWKVAYQSGNTKWWIPKCVWYNNSDPNNCLPGDNSLGNHKIIFHEITRIGKLNLPSDHRLWKERYERLKSSFTDPEQKEAVGDIWVATGWCGVGTKDPIRGGGWNPQNSQLQMEGCNDPLLKDFIFVVSKKGLPSERPPCNSGNDGQDNLLPCDNSRWGRSAGIPGGPVNPGGPDVDSSTKENSWWKFDVYYNFDSQPAPYNTVEFGNLPCWMGSCQRAKDNAFDPNLRISDPKCTVGPTPVTKNFTSPASLAILIKKTQLINKLYSKLSLIKQIPSTLNSLKENAIQKVKSFSLLFNKSVSAQTDFPQFVSGKGITYGIEIYNPLNTNLSQPDRNKLQAKLYLNTYILDSQVTLPDQAIITTVGDIIGRDGNITYVVKVLKSEFESASTRVNQLFLHTVADPGTVMKYNFVYSEASQGETLKLRTFYPPITESALPPIPAVFSYEWYTPACKPAIYLYPKTETKLSVSVIPQGKLTLSNPPYNQGWNNVLAKPNGELLYNNTIYPYLYYEAEIKNVNPPKEGWVVKKEELPTFFNTLLPYLGLNNKESQDFKDYWLNKLTDKPYYFIGLVNRNYLDQIETINFSTQPDTFIRVRFYFEGLDKPRLITLSSLPTTPKRTGFTAVDWGGMITGNSCSSKDIQIVR